MQTLSTESLQNFTYQYDAVGNITSIADSVNAQTQTFGYDDLDRLTSAGANGDSLQGGYATESYGYDGTTGNLASKAGVNYTYNSGHAHAVSSLSNGNSYSYDQNGNMTQRNADGKSFNFDYDAENRLVTVSGDSTATFVYNGDGQRVKSVMDGETTLFVGGHYQIADPGAGQTVSKYYMAGASRVALRKDGTLSYMLADHLGSTSLVTDANGNRTSELRYKPWGETRFSFGTMPTKYQFTGQFAYTDDPSTEGITEGFGLVYFNARWMDPQLGRFAQSDTVIPDGAQGLDRYAYANNNPIKYIDPSGHSSTSDDCDPETDLNCEIKVSKDECPSTETCGGAENLSTMLMLALLGFYGVYLKGEALESLQNDPGFLEEQSKLLAEIMAKPEFGKTDFVFSDVMSVKFGGERDPESMFLQLLFPDKFPKTRAVGANPLSWMLRNSTVYYDVRVTKEGKITISYKLRDVLDLNPGKGRSREYNMAADTLGTLWHGSLGASRMRVYANWTITIDPFNQNP